MPGYGGDIHIAKELSAGFKKSGGENNSRPPRRARQRRPVGNRPPNQAPNRGLRSLPPNQGTSKSASLMQPVQWVTQPVQWAMQPVQNTQSLTKQGLSSDSRPLASAYSNNGTNQGPSDKQTAATETNFMDLPIFEPQNKEAKRGLQNSRWNVASIEAALESQRVSSPLYSMTETDKVVSPREVSQEVSSVSEKTSEYPVPGSPHGLASSNKKLKGLNHSRWA